MFKYYLSFILLFLLWFFLRLLKGIYLGIKSYSWYEVEGVITDARMVNLGKVTTSLASTSVRQYTSLIKYDYKVLADTFEGKQVSLFPRGSSVSQKAINKDLNRYSVGSSVKVYYNPKQPNEAVLEKGLNIRALYAFIVIAIFNSIIL